MAGDAAAKRCRYPKKRRPSGEFLRGRSRRCWHWRARSAFSSPTSERRSDNKLGPFRSLFVRPYKVYCLAKCNNGTSIHSPSGSEKIVFVRSYSARAIFFLQKVYRFVSSLRRRDSRRRVAIVVSRSAVARIPFRHASRELRERRTRSSCGGRPFLAFCNAVVGHDVRRDHSRMSAVSTWTPSSVLGHLASVIL